MRLAFTLAFAFALAACGAPPEGVDDAGLPDAGPEPLGSCVDRCVDRGNGTIEYVADWQPESSFADVTCCECQDLARERWNARAGDCEGGLSTFVPDDACAVCP